MAQSNTFVVEAPIGATPVDLEVSPNGLIAVVISNSTTPGASDQKVSLWATGVSNPSQAQITPSPSGVVGVGNLPVSATGLPRFSDAVAMTNDRVIAIGSNAAEDRTYVDILAVTYASDPQATVIQTHTLGSGSTLSPTSAGLAHDIAITPDGALAVVSHRNWIHVFRLSDGVVAAAFNIGSNSAGVCDPGDSRNSVAVTNSRAIVTVRRASDLYTGQNQTWVYIIDLTQVSDPVIQLEYKLGHVPSSDTDTSPHDLAITPDGQRAVVTANRIVGLFDLTTDALVGSAFTDAADLRDWNGLSQHNIWDSVEVSNSRAVVLDNQAFGSTGDVVWRARIFNIAGSTLSQVQSYVSPYNLPSGSSTMDNCWDVAISDDGQFATIKTLRQDVALLDVVNGGAMRRAGDAVTLPDFSGAVGAPNGNDVTMILKPTTSDPQHLYGAFVGNGLLRYYDLYASAWSGTGSVPPTDLFTIPNNPPNAPVLPADLDRALDGRGVFLRTSAPVNDSNQTNKPDWSRYGSSPPTQAGSSWGGQGICVTSVGGVLVGDVMRLGRNKAVSISRDATTPNLGYIHVVTVQ